MPTLASRPRAKRSRAAPHPLPPTLPLIGQDPEPTLDPEALIKFIRKYNPPEAVVGPTPEQKQAEEGTLITATPGAVVEAVEGGLLKVIKGSIIKKKYKDQYKRNGFSCGDMLADELKAYVTTSERGKAPYMDEEKLREVALVNGVWKESYSALNKGQRRMTIGNCLRNKFKNGDRIDIGGVVLFDETLQEDEG